MPAGYCVYVSAMQCRFSTGWAMHSMPPSMPSAASMSCWAICRPSWASPNPVCTSCWHRPCAPATKWTGSCRKPPSWARPKSCRCRHNAAWRNSPAPAPTNAPNTGATSPFPPANNAAAIRCRNCTRRKTLEPGSTRCVLLRAANSSCCPAAPATFTRNPDREATPPCSSAPKVASPRMRPTLPGRPASPPSCLGRAYCAPKPPLLPALLHCKRFGGTSTSRSVRQGICPTTHLIYTRSISHHTHWLRGFAI
jgi:hypothetical protein